jgi:hypothetical protein
MGVFAESDAATEGTDWAVDGPQRGDETITSTGPDLDSRILALAAALVARRYRLRIVESHGQ